jgi:tryptophan 2,3-dioxygenase
MTTEQAPELLTYATYLRVPELLDLQTPVGTPMVHDELLFIILQQAQELWFKQVLHELREVISLLKRKDLPPATRLLRRVIQILHVLSEELEVMETLAPSEFLRFRGLLKPSSGFESEQFRELEFASGLRDDAFVRLIERIVDVNQLTSVWPTSLHDAFLPALSNVDEDPVGALVLIYRSPEMYAEHHALAEVLAEYETGFERWRFNHIKVVERVIGDRSMGTGGSSGVSYLDKTLKYRFFPELWEARNSITETGSLGHPGADTR